MFNFNNYFKYGFLAVLAIFLVLFVSTLISIHNETKEINCITYYSSLGYVASGCDSIVDRFIKDGN